jgi:hypothetical protein
VAANGRAGHCFGDDDGGACGGGGALLLHCGGRLADTCCQRDCRFPRYWSSRWFDNRSHTFDWGVYLARRFGMFTENASTKSQMMQSIDAAVALNVGRFYVTDQIGRYDRLPTYWD